jgi:acetoin utilization deacetylase AcuC-like enzyme
MTVPAAFARPFRAYTPASYEFPLPEGHRFPYYKYAGVRDLLAPHLPVLDTPALTWADATRVHDPLWLRRWRRGEVDRHEQRAFGLPWSPGVVERARAAPRSTRRYSASSIPSPSPRSSELRSLRKG